MNLNDRMKKMQLAMQSAVDKSRAAIIKAVEESGEPPLMESSVTTALAAEMAVKHNISLGVFLEGIEVSYAAESIMKEKKQ